MSGAYEPFISRHRFRTYSSELAWLETAFAPCASHCAGPIPSTRTGCLRDRPYTNRPWRSIRNPSRSGADSRVSSLAGFRTQPMSSAHGSSPEGTLALSPRNPLAHFARAQVLGALGRWQEAAAVTELHGAVWIGQNEGIISPALWARLCFIGSANWVGSQQQRAAQGRSSFHHGA
jgi:hypothetical protein